MVALLVLLLILAVFGGFGFAVHALWIVLLIALALWVLGFLVGGAESGMASGRRRWYGRW
ncbi:MAG: hydrophobic protein [Solirubrobacteraceae bacterium]